MRSFRDKRGFSLIEVLVAAFILFMVVTTVSVVYSNSVSSISQATSSLRINQYAPLIIENIKTKLREVESAQLQGEGHFLGVDYSWSSQQKERRKVIASMDTESLKNEQTGNKDIVLWLVTLNLNFKEKQRNYEFYALGWTAS